jgi:hypothetical protein
LGFEFSLYGFLCLLNLKGFQSLGVLLLHVFSFPSLVAGFV